MSNESNNTAKIPSNEEIINELTKDLEHHLIEEKESTKTEDCAKKTENYQQSDCFKDTNSLDPDPFKDNSDTENQEENCQEDDYVDEEVLKDLEVTLTEEERLERKEEALKLKQNGNEEHKSGKFIEAINTYTQALRLCPLSFSNDRAILYANRAASKIPAARQKSAIDDCTKAIELNSVYVRAYLRRAKLYEETDKLDESLEDYKKVLELDPSVSEARSACSRLPPLIEQRNEKLKTEMMGKLKDLGNLFLRPFGLSTDNFQLNQDPSTGGYSVNFTQNSKK